MPTPPEPRGEHPSTYFVQDRSNEEEMTRLQLQDQMLTAAMGGVLPEQADVAPFRRVLDVGCGTGGWLIEAARIYPAMSRLEGVDVSGKIVEYARVQAAAQQLDGRVRFHVMDALRMLEFPDESFDLVNQRLGQSFLRTWDWAKLLQEYQRITRLGGIIRITELDRLPESTSPALTRLNQIGLQALYQAGHAFTSEGGGITIDVAGLLHQHGLENVQTRAHVVEYRAGTAAGQFFFEDMRRLYRNLVPFLQKWTRVPEDYEAIYQQALVEMQQPDFVASWHLLTAWGTRP